MNSTTKTKTEGRRFQWRELFQRRRQRHDPMLVLNMTDFNFADSWDRVFNPLRAHQYSRSNATLSIQL